MRAKTKLLMSVSMVATLACEAPTYSSSTTRPELNLLADPAASISPLNATSPTLPPYSGPFTKTFTIKNTGNQGADFQAHFGPVGYITVDNWSPRLPKFLAPLASYQVTVTFHTIHQGNYSIIAQAHYYKAGLHLGAETYYYIPVVAPPPPCEPIPPQIVCEQ
jgi:hypothetical protein